MSKIEQPSEKMKIISNDETIQIIELIINAIYLFGILDLIEILTAFVLEIIIPKEASIISKILFKNFAFLFF